MTLISSSQMTFGRVLDDLGPVTPDLFQAPPYPGLFTAFICGSPEQLVFAVQEATHTQEHDTESPLRFIRRSRIPRSSECVECIRACHRHAVHSVVAKVSRPGTTFPHPTSPAEYNVLATHVERPPAQLVRLFPAMPTCRGVPPCLRSFCNSVT